MKDCDQWHAIFLLQLLLFSIHLSDFLPHNLHESNLDTVKMLPVAVMPQGQSMDGGCSPSHSWASIASRKVEDHHDKMAVLVLVGP